MHSPSSTQVMPEDIAEVALLPFKMSKNVVLEEITVQTGADLWCQKGCQHLSDSDQTMSLHLTIQCSLYVLECAVMLLLQARRPKSPRSSQQVVMREVASAASEGQK